MIGLLSIVAFFLMTTFASAQQPTLVIEPALRQPTVVTGRPMLTWWDVKYGGSGLLVGQFQFVIRHDETVLAVTQTEEMTLNAPGQRIRVMLPAVESPNAIDQLQLEISFQGKKNSAKLGEHVLRCNFRSKKMFLGLVAESRMFATRSLQNSFSTRHLNFELLASKQESFQNSDSDLNFVKTIFAPIEATDLPSEPLNYCGYDLVVLPNEEFRLLRRPQLDALLAWIKAGGSLFIEPKGILEKYHVDFLKSLVADNLQGLAFELDPAGKLPAETVPPEKEIATVECGLGVAVIRTSEAEQQNSVPSQQWLAALASIWKRRLQPVEQPQVHRFVNGPNGLPVEQMAENPDPYGLAASQLNRFRLPQGDLLDRMMPEGVRMVPTWVLASILGTFILLIGPADYFVLGWLRARKFTWLTFPLVTIAITTFTFWMSNRYMTSSETVRSVEIHDLDNFNDIVRTNRFELLYLAMSGRAETNVEKGIFTPIDNFIENTQASISPITIRGLRTLGYASPRLMGLAKPATYTVSRSETEGRIPTQYTAAQNLTKWTPQLNRILSIPLTPIRSDIDWSAFRLNAQELTQIEKQSFPSKIRERVNQQFGPKAMAACFTGLMGWAYDHSPSWTSSRSKVSEFYERFQTPIGYFQPIDRHIQNEPAFFRWLYDVSVAAPNPGLFSLIRQTSPKGNVDCDDLPLLDCSDPKAWLLVVVVPTNDGYSVYRKRMRVDD